QHGYAAAQFTVLDAQDGAKEVDNQALAVNGRDDLRRARRVVVRLRQQELAAKGSSHVAGNLLGSEVIDVFAGERPLAPQRRLLVLVKPGPEIQRLPADDKGIVVGFEF